jgi:hypothetical protein
LDKSNLKGENKMAEWIKLTIGLIAFFIIIIWAAIEAAAQEEVPVEEVIVLLPSGGVFPAKFQAPPDLDVIEVCCARTDADPSVDLGCTAVTPGEVKTMEVSVPSTPGDDGELRCYARDTGENVSTYSKQAFSLDFTPPGSPVMLP